MTLIRIVDVETTGIDDPAEMVECGWTDVHVTATGQIMIDPSGPRSRMVKPRLPISYPAMAVHHITEAMVEGGEDPDECRAMLAYGADILCAHKSEFDSRFVRGHNLPWICTFKAARTLWPDMQAHTNGAIRYERGLCAHDARAMPSHRAGPDTWVTAHILVELLETVSVERLIEITRNPVLLHKVSFGEHAGKPWSEVPDGYLDWILNKSTMPSDPKKEDEVFTARTEMARRYPPQEPELQKSVPSAEPPAAAVDQPTTKASKLAQRAGIICGEKGFGTFVSNKYDDKIETADAAAVWLRAACGVESRSELDRNDAAGAQYLAIEKSYRLWLEGYD